MEHTPRDSLSFIHIIPLSVASHAKCGANPGGGEAKKNQDMTVEIHGSKIEENVYQVMISRTNLARVGG